MYYVVFEGTDPTGRHGLAQGVRTVLIFSDQTEADFYHNQHPRDIIFREGDESVFPLDEAFALIREVPQYIETQARLRRLNYDGEGTDPTAQFFALETCIINRGGEIIES